MTAAYCCVLIATLMPYIFVALAKIGCPKYSNATPRESVERLVGWHKRAYWARLNSFEAFPAFAAAVIIANQLHVSQLYIDRIAVAFIAMRVMYGIFYIFYKPTWRTITWRVGTACMIALFL